MTSRWDTSIPELTLDDVRVHAGSLSEAWKDLSTDYLVRSVLVVSDREVETTPFDYEARNHTVHDLYDAVATAYELTWIRDERTGVAWFFPEDLTYDDLLATHVQVVHDHLGLPMQSGILEPLAAADATDFVAKEWGSAFRNTFDYAVDVPAGPYALRDVLNLCCVANPTKSFVAQLWSDSVFVTAVNLVSDEKHSVPSGALHLWDVEIRIDRRKQAPTPSQVMTALADRRPKVRHAARNYLELIIGEVRVEEWVRRDTPIEQALWTLIGAVSVLVRSEETTYCVAIEMMEQRATDDVLAEGDPRLALMTALELARLTRDTSALDVVGARSLGDDVLAGVAYDACRVAALSGYVREMLRVRLTESALDVPKPLVELVRSATPGKLDFKVNATSHE